MVCFKQNLLSFFGNSFSSSRDLYFKNKWKIGKFWDPKIRAQRWIRFSQYTIPVGKQKEVIVLWHVGNNNVWVFCKQILELLIIPILKCFLFIVKCLFWWHSKTEANLPYSFLQHLLGLYFVPEPFIFTKNW